MEVVTASGMKPLRRDTRTSSRRPLVVRARLSWKDQRGTTRIANVLTRNVSDEAVYVEWRESSSIPLYRLVQFQLSVEARRDAGLPEALRIGKVLSAVLRAGERRAATGTPEGYALRLLVVPGQKSADSIEGDGVSALVSATAIA